MIQYVTKRKKAQWAVLFLYHDCVVFAGLSGRRMADWLLNAGTVRIRSENAGPHWPHANAAKAVCRAPFLLQNPSEKAELILVTGFIKTWSISPFIKS